MKIKKVRKNLILMTDKNLQRKWVREEVIILVTEYFRTKDLSTESINESYHQISRFLRRREEILTEKTVSDVFRDYAGIRMQSGRIKCLDPKTKYSGMKGTKLQEEIVREYLANPQALILEAEQIYEKYK